MESRRPRRPMLPRRGCRRLPDGALGAASRSRRSRWSATARRSAFSASTSSGPSIGGGGTACACGTPASRISPAATSVSTASSRSRTTTGSRASRSRIATSAIAGTGGARGGDRSPDRAAVGGAVRGNARLRPRVLSRRAHGIPARVARAAARQGVRHPARPAALAGYGVVRPARNGFKVGPLFADDPELADALLGRARGLRARTACRCSSTCPKPTRRPSRSRIAAG